MSQNERRRRIACGGSYCPKRGGSGVSGRLHRGRGVFWYPEVLRSGSGCRWRRGGWRRARAWMRGGRSGGQRFFFLKAMAAWCSRAKKEEGRGGGGRWARPRGGGRRRRGGRHRVGTRTARLGWLQAVLLERQCALAAEAGWGTGEGGAAGATRGDGARAGPIGGTGARRDPVGSGRGARERER
jgi:hypothetical protein